MERGTMTQKIIIDTHILLWSLLEEEKLSSQELHIIKAAQIEGTLFISSISLWEIAMLSYKGRISIYGRLLEFLGDIKNVKGLRIYDIDPEVAAESVSLPGDFHGDPADRIIVATTRVLSGNLITRDSGIQEWAKDGYLRVNEFDHAQINR